MADQRSLEMLAFNFASRTFAYKRLAQGLSRSVSAFQASCASTWTQLSRLTNVLNTWTILESQTTMLRILPGTFGQSSSAFATQDIKLTIQKCHFGVRKVEFLGRTISSEGVSPQDHKIQNFLNKLRFPKSKKALQRSLGFVNYYKNYIPRMAEKLNPFYKLLKQRSLSTSHQN